jgi:hypothetical protein
MRILVPDYLGAPARCFYQDFRDGIIKALCELGHDTVQFSFSERGQVQLEEAKTLYRHIDGGKFGLVIDLACFGYGLSRILIPSESGASEPLFDVFGVPYAGWLFDHPFNQDISVVMAKGCHAIYPDLGHPGQVRLVYPDLRLTGEIFAPPAIRPENNRSAENWSSNRDIDVLYVGNLVPEVLRRWWREKDSRQWLGMLDPGFCDTLADAILYQPERSLHLSLQSAIAEYGMPSASDVRFHLSIVEQFIRHIVRRDTVVALAGSGVRMRVVGKGWDRVGLPANVEIGAQTDYEGFFGLAGRAKICLDASTYLDGANDRVFSYALNRAVCFTNASGYLRRIFGDHGGMRFFAMRNLSELGEQVKALLARPADLQEAGERAFEIVLSAHTWRHRVNDVMGAMAL